MLPPVKETHAHTNTQLPLTLATSGRALQSSRHARNLRDSSDSQRWPRIPSPPNTQQLHTPVMARAMDKPTLEYIMRSLTTRDRALQRHIADTYLAEDITLTHLLGDVRGREAFYGVYRAAVSGLNYKLHVIDMIIEEQPGGSGGKAACWVDLNLKVAPFYLKRYHAPTIVMLRWRRDPTDGLCRITEQIDHHSLYVIMWLFGWPLSAFFDLVARRVTGRLMSLTGWGVDALEDAAASVASVSPLPGAWSSRLGLTRVAVPQQSKAPGDEVIACEMR